MKENVRAFERRTGRHYQPPAALRRIARPLTAAAACPTLFRDPGPAGIRDLLLGRLLHLAPPGERWVWLAPEPAPEHRRGPRLFGTVAILEPLRLAPCRVEGAFLVSNRRLDPRSLLWVPPRYVRRGLPWNDLVFPDRARTAMGATLAREERRVKQDLGRYFEELGRLAAAGAPDPKRPWCELSAAARRKVLDTHGVVPAWTKTKPSR